MNLAEQLFQKGFDVDRVKNIVTIVAGSPGSRLEDVFANMIPLDIRNKFIEECWETIEEYSCD